MWRQFPKLFRNLVALACGVSAFSFPAKAGRCARKFHWKFQGPPAVRNLCVGGGFWSWLSKKETKSVGQAWSQRFEKGETPYHLVVSLSPMRLQKIEGLPLGMAQCDDEDARLPRHVARYRSLEPRGQVDATDVSRRDAYRSGPEAMGRRCSRRLH